jgi:hypothetical protein
MGTFTLIIWIGAGAWAFEGTHTPGLTEIECQLRASEVQPPQRAKCVRVCPPCGYHPDCATCGTSIPRRKPD